MAQITKTVAAGHAGIAPFSLSGTDYYDVTFTDNVGPIQVYSDGSSADAWVTSDLTITSVPSAGASTKCLCLPLGAIADLTIDTKGATDTVRILSTGTPRVGVQAA